MSRSAEDVQKPAKKNISSMISKKRSEENLDEEERFLRNYFAEHVEIYEYHEEPPMRDEDFFEDRTGFLLVFATFGVNDSLFPYIFRTATYSSGGVFLVVSLLCSTLFALPIILTEIFLGKYTQRTNAYLYGMAPIFFGLCVVIFVLNGFSQPWHITEETQILVNLCRLVLHRDVFSKCPENATSACFDYKIKGPVNEECKSVHGGVMCENLGFIQYPAAYMYYRDYLIYNDPNYPAWQLFFGLVFTWTFITFFGNKSMSSITNLVYYLSIAWIIIHAAIFMMVFFYDGHELGFRNMWIVQANKINFYEILIIASMTVPRLALIVPMGYMTASAYTNFKINPGMDSLVIFGWSTVFMFCKMAIFFGVSGVVSTAMGVDFESVFVPGKGLYLALMQEFFEYAKVSRIISTLYYAIIWAFEIVKCVVYLNFWVLNLYDYFPYMREQVFYVWITISTIMTFASIFAINQFVIAILLPLMYMAHFSSGALFILAIQSTMIFYVYGVQRLSDDIHFFTGNPPIKLCKFLWFICPPLLWMLYILLKLPRPNVVVENDLTQQQIDRGKIYLALIYYGLELTMIVSSISYVALKLSLEEVFLELFKPHITWGSRDITTRVRRKNFFPRLSIKSVSSRKKTVRDESLLKLATIKVAATRNFSDITYFTEIKMQSNGMMRRNATMASDSDSLIFF